MLTAAGKLQIVILDNPYDCWEQRLAQEFFQKMVSLKLTGYKVEYPYGVLPVDTTDFFSTHQFVCRVEADGDLMPLMAYRSVDLHRCRTHNVAFPPLTLARTGGTPDHEKAVQALIDDCDRRGVNFDWSSSWTAHPDARKDRAVGRLLRDLFEVLYVYQHLECKIPDLILGAVLRFKTDKVFGSLGHSGLALNGVVLKPVKVMSLLGEETQIMNAPCLSEVAIAKVRPWQELWDARLIIDRASTADLRFRRAA